NNLASREAARMQATNAQPANERLRAPRVAPPASPAAVPMSPASERVAAPTRGRADSSSRGRCSGAGGCRSGSATAAVAAIGCVGTFGIARADGCECAHVAAGRVAPAAVLATSDPRLAEALGQLEIYEPSDVTLTSIDELKTDLAEIGFALSKAAWKRLQNQKAVGATDARGRDVSATAAAPAPSGARAGSGREGPAHAAHTHNPHSTQGAGRGSVAATAAAATANVGLADGAMSSSH
ncbi:hypothetical protein OAO87_04695, partial [bacterium]|nr:hypothetical protein [bacterium]